MSPVSKPLPQWHGPLTDDFPTIAKWAVGRTVSTSMLAADLRRALAWCESGQTHPNPAPGSGPLPGADPGRAVDGTPAPRLVGVPSEPASDEGSSK